MAKKELPDEGPSLEMPSLGSLFKRGRKKPAQEEARNDAAQQPSTEDFERLVQGRQVDEPAAAAEAEQVAAVTPPAESESAVDQTTVRDLPAVPADTPAGASTEAPAAPQAAEVEETEVVSELPEHDLIAEAEEPDLADIEADDAPTDSAATDAPATDDVEQSAVASSKPVPAAPEESRTHGGSPVARSAAASATKESEPAEDGLVEGEPSEDQPAAEKPRRSAPGFTLPALPGIAAASVTGVLVGILAVALTYFGLRGCEALRGTSTCGGPGIQILIVNMIILVVVGSMLLKAWKVADPTSTSFLAVGLLAVISLLFLIEVIFSPAMFVVIPLVSAGTYALSQWVTERFIEEE